MLTSDANLEPIQRSMTDHLCENDQQLKVVNYLLFSQNSAITDVRLGSKYASIP